MERHSGEKRLKICNASGDINERKELSKAQEDSNVRLSNKLRNEEESTNCNQPELFRASQTVHFSCLPDGVLLEIFSKLSNNTLINIAPVCKRWSELTKHKSLWLREDAVFERYHSHWFLRRVRAARYLRLLDLSDMQAERGELLDALLSGPIDVRKFNCFYVAAPSFIVELLERYGHSLEELNISLSDERISYGEDGLTFRSGIDPRPGRLLSIIADMRNLRILRFTSSLPTIAVHQGRVDPKWYFGELENPSLQLEAISMRFGKPRKVLVEKFVVPFLYSKRSFVKELRLTADLWKITDVQKVVQQFSRLEAILRLPVDGLCALKTFNKNIFLDIILAGWADYRKARDVLSGGLPGLECIEELSLRFCDQLYLLIEEPVPDTRLEGFMRAFGKHLRSLKRLHIYRWDAAPPFVESVHTSRALPNLFDNVRTTLEEVHVSDSFRGGRNMPHLMRAVRENLPRLKSRGIVVNRLGNRGLLFSLHQRECSKIANCKELKLEYGKAELGSGC